MYTFYMLLAEIGIALFLYVYLFKLSIDKTLIEKWIRRSNEHLGISSKVSKRRIAYTQLFVRMCLLLLTVLYLLVGRFIVQLASIG